MTTAPSAGDHRAADPDADPHAVARAIALRQLTMAPRSRAELRAAMDRRAVPPDVAETVLDRLTEVGLVDDRAFAEAWVRSRQSTRGLARRTLVHELRRKGVADEVAASAVDPIDADAEVAAARRLVERRLAATATLAPQVRLRRLTGMLTRKGYSGGLALQVVRQALAGDGPGPEDAGR